MNALTLIARETRPRFGVEEDACHLHPDFTQRHEREGLGTNLEPKWSFSRKPIIERWVIHEVKPQEELRCSLHAWFEVATSYQKAEAEVLARRFKLLADSWKRETAFVSMLPKKVLHPAYQRIIGMGMPAVPLILRELQKSRGHWLWALHAITGEDPAQSGDSFDQAIDAWINWGKKQGLL